MLTRDSGCWWLSKENPKCSTVGDTLTSSVKAFREDLWEVVRFRWGYRDEPPGWVCFLVGTDAKGLFAPSLAWGGGTVRRQAPANQEDGRHEKQPCGYLSLILWISGPPENKCLLFHPTHSPSITAAEAKVSEEQVRLLPVLAADLGMVQEMLRCCTLLQTQTLLPLLTP